MKTKLRAIIGLILATFCAATALAAEPMGTAFTFQGQLKENGVPIGDKTCDFHVGLFSSEVGGSQLGVTQVIPAAVKNGLFMLILNESGEYGSTAFNGERRWLDIKVSCDSGVAAVSLGRQELTATPYAHRTASAAGVDTVWQMNAPDVYYNDGNVGIGTTSPRMKLDIHGGDLRIVDDAPGEGPQFQTWGPEGGEAGTWAAHAGGEIKWLTRINDTEAGVRYSLTDYQAAASRLLIDEVGNVGIGTVGPDTQLHVKSGDTPADHKVLTLESDSTVGTSLLLKNNYTNGRTWKISSFTNSAPGFKGSFMISDATTGFDQHRLAISPTGDVGIGTFTPGAKLDVVTNVRSSRAGDPSQHVEIASPGSQGLFVTGHSREDNKKNLVIQNVYDSTGSPTGPNAIIFRNGAESSPTERMRINDEGNVGIGTRDPLAKLAISNVGENDTTPILSMSEANSLEFFFESGFAGVGATGNHLKLKTGWDDAIAMSWRGDGYVGIGTTDPSYELHVVRDNEVNADVGIENTNSALGTRVRLWMKTPNQVWGIENDGAMGHIFKVRDHTAGADRLAIDTNGNVGIGTTEPTARLDIAGNLKFSANEPRIIGGTGSKQFSIYPDGGAGDSRSWIEFWGDHTGGDRDGELTLAGTYVDLYYGSTTDSVGQTGLRLTANGNVGIGTTNPAASLEIEGDSSVGAPLLRLTENEDDFARMTFGNTGNSRSWQIRGLTRDGSPGFNDEFSIAHSRGHTIMMIRDDGATSRVGIGTTLPETMLHVEGTTTTRVLRITGADLAEKFPVSEQVEPGEVVEIDPNNPGKLRRSSQAYNRRVAGVVSGANGLSVGVVLGNLPGNEDAPAIAMSGRVWVHCDAANGAIQPGDMLTTSDTPGHAMKAIDHDKAQGAIIGKAMTALDAGKTGLVLVLVSLQ